MNTSSHFLDESLDEDPLGTTFEKSWDSQFSGNPNSGRRWSEQSVTRPKMSKGTRPLGPSSSFRLCPVIEERISRQKSETYEVVDSDNSKFMFSVISEIPVEEEPEPAVASWRISRSFRRHFRLVLI